VIPSRSPKSQKPPERPELPTKGGMLRIEKKEGHNAGTSTEGNDGAGVFVATIITKCMEENHNAHIEGLDSCLDEWVPLTAPEDRDVWDQQRIQCQADVFRSGRNIATDAETAEVLI